MYIYKKLMMILIFIIPFFVLSGSLVSFVNSTNQKYSADQPWPVQPVVSSTDNVYGPAKQTPEVWAAGNTNSIPVTVRNSINDNIWEKLNTNGNSNGNNNARSARATGGESWPMLKNTPQRTGQTTSKIPSSSDILWTNESAPTYASPVVAYNKVYMSTNDGHLYCFEETTGRLRWRVQVSPENFSAISTPAVHSGHIVVFSSANGSVFRFDAYTGELDWVFTLPGDNTTLNVSYLDHPILIYNGYILFGAPDRYLYCLKENSGNLVWRFKTLEGLTYDHGITCGAAALGDKIYFGANDGYLYSMDLDGFADGNQGWLTEEFTGSSDGDLLWKYYLGDSISSTPVVNNNYVYAAVGVHNSSLGEQKVYKIYCMDRINGTVVWDYKAADHIISSPTVVDNKLYFGCMDGKIYSLATDTNTSQWVPFVTGGPVWSSPAVAGGRLLVGSTDSKLYYLYSHNGLEIWRKQLNGPITSSPALANNRLFINTQDGRIYAFGPRDSILPVITNVTPIKDGTDVPVSNLFTVVFSEQLNPDRIIDENVQLYDSQMDSLPVKLEYEDETQTISIKPKNFLNPLERYTITVKAGIMDCAGNKLDGNKNGVIDMAPLDDHSWSFTTSSNHPPKLTGAKVTPARGNLATKFLFSVLYTDVDNDGPGTNHDDIWIFIDNDISGNKMQLNNTPNKLLRNGVYDDGEEYSFETKIDTYGIHSFRIWCSDGTDWNETVVLGQPVMPGPPTIAPIPELHLTEDILFDLNVTEYLYDPDTRLDQLSIHANSSYATVNGSIISFLYTNSFNYPTGRKYEVVNISVSDGVYFAYTEIMVWVTPINDPPIIKTIPTQIAIEKIDLPINLKDYIIDVDNEFEELIITDDSNFTELDEAGLNLILNYPTGGFEYNIILNVSDGEYWTLGEIQVKVVSSEVSFVLRDLPELQVLEDIPFTLNLEEYLMIIQGSAKNIKLSTRSEYSQVQNLTIIFLYPNSFNYPEERKFEDVNITITDPTVDYSQSVMVRIRVISINDPPILVNGTVKPMYGNITSVFTFQAYYFDVDGSENVKVYVMVDGNRFELTKVSGEKTLDPGAEYTYKTQLDIGYHYYYFECDDRSGEPNSKFNTQPVKFIVTGNLDPRYSSEVGTEPGKQQKLDSDLDMIPDEWELLYGLDPNNSSDAMEDLDGDNFNSLKEYLGSDGLLGGNDSTDPTNASDMPKTTAKKRETIESELGYWPLLVGVFGVIVVVIIIVYSLHLGSGIGKSIHVSKDGKYGSRKGGFGFEDEDIDEDMDENVDVDKDGYEDDRPDEDLGKVESGARTPDLEDIDDEIPEDVVPVTEVNLTDEDKPFFETDDNDENNDEDTDMTKVKDTDTLKEDTPEPE